MKHLLLASVILLSGCGVEDRSHGMEIDAVFWHEGNSYSVGYEKNEQWFVKNIFYQHNQNAPKVYLDVPEGKKSWYNCDLEWRAWDGMSGQCEIHIHNFNELQTSGWNHGKFGSGTTKRID